MRIDEKSDRKTVLAAVQQEGLDLEYASGSMEFGYGAPPEEIEKIKKSLGL